MKETETSAPTPEQLLSFLTAEVEMNRARRARSRKGRGMILVVGITFILIGACVALFVLSSMVTDLPRSASEGDVAQTVAVQH